MKRNIAVFCGSSTGSNPVYIEQATQFGELLATQDRTLIYGGAQVGCMGAIANKALEKKGKVIGVIPEKLRTVEIAHNGLSELHVVQTMHQRKAKMAELADAFIALPGGAGTLEEWFEVFTWSQIGYHNKPCAFLNVDGFYDPLLQMIDHTIEKGFMREEYKQQILFSADVEEILEKIDSYEKVIVDKWSD